jgi:tRNA(Ile)-lysidine synthase
MRGAAAVTADEFARLMACCGPFEPRPLLAVAVSGGADSLALALLADEWARARHGRIVALTVDHGLRAEARAEARSVARWMKRRGIAHRALVWRGAKPSAGVQARAREARYRLLGEACRGAFALHLLLGHTRDDQAETVLLRLAAGSGPHGLAAMPPVHEKADYRLVRPLLGMPRARLRATLTARGQDCIEDPSNRDERFARIRVRRLLAEAQCGAEHSAAIAGAADELGRFRARRERAIADVLARAVSIFPEGHARLDPAPLAGSPPEVGWRALAALLGTIGGLGYPPRAEAVRELHADLGAGRLGRGRTLARCRLVPDGAHWLVVREARGVEAVRLRASASIAAWDGRFAIKVKGMAPGGNIGPLGAAGWAELVAAQSALRATPVPYPARLTLPALRDRTGIAAVPSLGYRRRGCPEKTLIAAPAPLRPLAPAVFAAPFPP